MSGNDGYTAGSGDLWGFDVSPIDHARPNSFWDPFPSSAHKYVWQDDAACNGVDPELFEVANEGEPAALGYPARSKALLQLNMDRHEQAKSICEGCPVRATCLSSADPSDLYWTTRGGQLPAFLKPREKNQNGKKGPAFKFDDYNLWSCRKHDRKAVGVRDRTKLNGEAYQAPYCKICDAG